MKVRTREGILLASLILMGIMGCAAILDASIAKQDRICQEGWC